MTGLNHTMFMYNILTAFELQSFECTIKLEKNELQQIVESNRQLAAHNTLATFTVCVQGYHVAINAIPHLDVSQNAVRVEDLEFLHPDARLTHLFATDCTQIEPMGVLVDHDTRGEFQVCYIGISLEYVECRGSARSQAEVRSSDDMVACFD